MHLTTKGLVIRTVDWRDSDRLLTVMTEDYGKITVKAPNIRRKSSRMGWAGQLFAYCQFTLYEKNGRLTLQDAQMLEQFFSLSRDLDALALGSYFCELLATEGEEDVPAPGMLRLALNSLYALAHHLYDIRQIKAAFDEAKATKGMPTAIIAKTVKGKGVSFMENEAGWHGKAPNDEEYAVAMQELRAQLSELEGQA